MEEEVLLLLPLVWEGALEEDLLLLVLLLQHLVKPLKPLLPPALSEKAERSDRTFLSSRNICRESLGALGDAGPEILHELKRRNPA